MIKIFGIGNVLLSDDGIGVRIVEHLRDKLMDLNDYYKQYDEEIAVIIGENDYLYCLNNIKEDDYIIIIDATCFMIKPATVTIRNLKECDEFIEGDFVPLTRIQCRVCCLQSFLNSVRREKNNIDGWLIGIEVSKIDYSLQLSKELSKKFNFISYSVFNKIIEIINRKLSEINYKKYNNKL